MGNRTKQWNMKIKGHGEKRMGQRWIERGRQREREKDRASKGDR